MTIQRTNQSSNQCHVAGRTAKRRMRVRLAWCSNVKQSKCELLPTFKWKPLVDHCLILISLTSCREKMGELVRRGPQVFRGPRWVCPKSKKKSEQIGLTSKTLYPSRSHVKKLESVLLIHSQWSLLGVRPLCSLHTFMFICCALEIIKTAI